MENSPARPYILWRSENATSLYYIDQKHLYTIGKRCTCDITFPNSSLLPTHACLYRIVRRNRVCYSITPCSSGNVLVNDTVVPCGQKKELAFHDVITLVEGAQSIHLTFSQKRGVSIVDNTRPSITWESKSFICVRYLEEKKMFTIGSDRGCDISLASPYLAATHAELMKNVLKGTVQYAVRPALTRRASLFVNGTPVSRRGQKNLASGDVLTVSRDTNSVKFCFHNGEGDNSHATTTTAMATPSAHRIQRTLPISSPQSSASILPESRRTSLRQRRSRSTNITRNIKQPEDVNVIQQATRQEGNDNLPLNQLEANLTCCVCLSIFFKPINIDPCNHKCCYSCMLSWLKQNGFFGKCPQCRTNILSIKLDPAVNSIVETFLRIKPVLRRSHEEIALLEASEARNLNEYQHLVQYSMTADAFRSQTRSQLRRWMS